MVDFWGKRSGQDGKVDNFVDRRTQDIARANVMPYGSRVHLLRAMSADAAKSFPDAYFDWAYIDALHTYAAVLADLLP